MAGPRKFEKQAPGEPLEVVIPPMLEVPQRSVFYKRKVKFYEVGLKAGRRLPANTNPQKAADIFMKTPQFQKLMTAARRNAGYRDDGSSRWRHLPNGYRERVQFNYQELMDAFWSGWYGYGMLDRGPRGVVSREGA